MIRRIREYLNGMSVINKLVAIFSVICIVPLVVFIFYVYNKVTAEITYGARSALSQNLSYATTRIEQRVDQVERSCAELTSSKNPINTFISSRYKGTGDEIINYNQTIYPLIEQRVMLTPDVYSVWLFTNNKSIPNSWKVIAGIAQIDLWDMDASNKPVARDYWWEKDHDSTIPFKPESERNAGKMYSFNRVIRTKEGIPGGIVSYQIQKSKLFSEVTERREDDSLMYILDDDGRVIYSDSPNQYGESFLELYHEQREMLEYAEDVSHTGIVESRDYIFGIERVDTLDCRVMLVSPLSGIHRETNVMTLEMLGILVLACSVVIVLIYLTSMSIMKRMRQLAQAMRQVDRGDYSISVDTGPMDEFGTLITSFNRMIAKIDELINNVYKVQLREKDAQFRALEAQINPHFLYNSLTSIAYVARGNNDAEGYKMALALGKFYRMGLSKKTELITVAEEIEYLNMYLTIQKIRFKDRVGYRFDIDEDYLDCKLIRNLLQPLVENAISHGLEEKVEGGVIKISVHGGGESEQRLLITVEDNGVGMDSVWIAAINSGSFEEGLSGYGLKNVCERLRIYYADGCAINARSTFGAGTAITLSIPIIR